MKTISVQSRSFQASQATICGDREHAPAAKYSFMSGSLLQHAPNAQRQWRPDRGYNPALVKPWSNRGQLSGDQQLMERNVRYRLVKFDHYPGVLSLILLSAQAGSRKGHETGILHGKTKTA